MDIIALILLYLTMFLGCYVLHLRDRVSKLKHQNDMLRWRSVHERQRANALKMARDKLRHQRDDDWVVVEQMQEQIVAVEERNHWLEQRRFIVLSRWWRRRKHRCLAGWRIGKRTSH